MVLVRSLPSALVVAALALFGGACGPNKAPTTAPADDDASGFTLRYAAPERPIEQTLELQLTQTRLGLYLEADLTAAAQLQLAAKGDGLRTEWAVVDLPSFELTGSLEPGDAPKVEALLKAAAKGATIGDAHGMVDGPATDADPLNAARLGAAAGPPAAAPLVMAAVAEQLRLPRLPAVPLELDEPIEVEEESETVVTDAEELVLPTTTVHRFTLRKVETMGNTRVAEVEVAIASVAQPEEEIPEGAEPPPEDSVPAAELRTQAEGLLVFDLDRNLPVSLELSRSELLRVGEQEMERSLQVRATFAAP